MGEKKKKMPENKKRNTKKGKALIFVVFMPARGFLVNKIQGKSPIENSEKKSG
jgi:hypothetical protein